MIAAELIGSERVLSFMESLQAGTRDSMKRAVLRLAIMLQNYVKQNELTGQALHTRTGRLKGSITAKATDDGTTFAGIVGTNVVYARIHEMGGQTKAHDIFPIHGKALMFARAGFIGPRESMTTKGGRYAKGKAGAVSRAIGEGSMQFARAVHHPGSKIPERSFLRSALGALGPEITAGLAAALKEAVK